MLEDSPTPLDKMQRAIQLAGFHYIVCMKSRPTNADHRLTIGKMEYVFEAIGRAPNGCLHAEFQNWAAMAVLRDLIESFSILLFEVYRSAMRQYPDIVYSDTLDKFERKGIEDQLRVLSNDFDIDDAWTQRMVGYNRARNCLAHRQGIVGQRDVNEGGELVIRWLVSKAEQIPGQAEPYIDTIGPINHLIRASHIHGGAVRLEIQDKERRARIGSSLSFLPTDILEICQTFQMASAAFAYLPSKDEPLSSK